MAVQLLIVAFFTRLQVFYALIILSQYSEWLLPDYQSLYESVPSLLVRQEAPAPIAAPQTQQVPATDLPQPDFGFSTNPQELVGSRTQLNRLLGLSTFITSILRIRKSFMSSVRFVYP